MDTNNSIDKNSDGCGKPCAGPLLPSPLKTAVLFVGGFFIVIRSLHLTNFLVSDLIQKKKHLKWLLQDWNSVLNFQTQFILHQSWIILSTDWGWTWPSIGFSSSFEGGKKKESYAFSMPVLITLVWIMFFQKVKWTGCPFLTMQIAD